MFKRVRFSALRAISMILLMAMIGLSVQTAAAGSKPGSNYSFTTIFGLDNNPDGSLLVADAGAGVVQIRHGRGSLIAALPGISDMAPLGGGKLVAITSGPDAKLYRIGHSKAKMIADLGAFENTVNPDAPEINSNPFDVQALKGGNVLVADAGGNDLLFIDKKGNIDWVVTLPEELVSTANGKFLVGCPNPVSEELAFVCDLPDMIPAQAVATSIAVGPDGAYYMGELKGFPGALGVSRIWRIDPSARHERCGESPKCSVVADGFTSIVDLAFGRDGTLYVTEIDEASFLAIELGIPGLAQGGTVNACNSTTWECSEFATGLNIPIATTVTRNGQVYVAINALIPGEAQVIPLP